MKIIQLIQKRQLRGAEMFACQLSNELIKQGHEVIMIALFTGNETLPFNGTIIELKGTPGKRLLDWKAWKKLAKIIKETQPALVQANAGDTLKYAAMSKMFFRWKQPIVFRNASVISRYIKSGFAKALNQILYSKVDKVISVSHSSKKDFLSLFNSFQDKIDVVPIGVEKEMLSIENVGRESDAIIHVGGFTFEKNHHGVISIFDAVKKTIPSCKLYLVGDGPRKQDIVTFASQLASKDSIHFLGNRNDVIELIAKASVLILPSIIEGLPAVVLEAFACGTPVVAYNVGGIEEVVKEKETGRLIESGDEAAFVEAVVELLNNFDAAQELSNNAKKLVQNEFVNDVIAKAFERNYKQLIRE